MRSILLYLGLLAAAVPATPVEQQPLGVGIAPSKGLRGRFLHVTGKTNVWLS